jgi:hypothetical protein
MNTTDQHERHGSASVLRPVFSIDPRPTYPAPRNQEGTVTVLAEAATRTEETHMAHPPVGEGVLSLLPIPLATGTTVLGESGQPVRIEKVEILVTDENGRETKIPLDLRLNGWWGPAPQ